MEKAIEDNPDAVAILVNNPTYYGICSNLKKIVEIAHAHNMLVLVDEAHGTHFYFGENMPITAMAAGADMASVSMHKSGGSDPELVSFNGAQCQRRLCTAGHQRPRPPALPTCFWQVSIFPAEI